MGRFASSRIVERAAWIRSSGTERGGWSACRTCEISWVMRFHHGKDDEKWERRHTVNGRILGTRDTELKESEKSSDLVSTSK